MKFKKILMVGFYEGTLGETEWNRLDQLGEARILLPKDSPDIPEHLASADCLLVTLGATVDMEMIDHAPRLKYIGMFGTGYGGINAKYAASKGIAVCNIAGYSTEGVAELAFALILENIREIERAKAQARAGYYAEVGYHESEIMGKRFGIIGLGRIGGRIAEIAKNGFGADVTYWSRTRKKQFEMNGVRYQEVESLLKESDFISLNLAYIDPDTKHFLNAERIKLIRLGGVVINLAPMQLVDIDALVERLKIGNITFILDHSDELTTKEALQLSTYKNCIMYPPIGNITNEATSVKLSRFVDNIKNFLKGKPTNKVN